MITSALVSRKPKGRVNYEKIVVEINDRVNTAWGKGTLVKIIHVGGSNVRLAVKLDDADVSEAAGVVTVDTLR